MMVAVGSAILLVVVVSTATRIGSARHGVHPSVLLPIVVIAGALLYVPIGQNLGGTWAKAAEWVWLLGGLASVPAGNLLGSAVVAHRRLRRNAPSRYTEECPTLSQISEIERSLEDDFEALTFRSASSSTPREAEYR